MLGTLPDARHCAWQQGGNGDCDGYSLALKELTVWRESDKHKAVIRGHMSAGLRVYAQNVAEAQR